MITDLVQIRRLGEQNRKENEALRKHMKRHEVPEKKLRRIAEDVEEQIDCQTCANCCRVATAKVTERDAEKLAKFLRMPLGRFYADYVDEDEEDGAILKRTEAGCVFLDGTTCTVYEARPASCEAFPHVVRGAGSITSRMWQFIDRATYCPIVFNSLEGFKKELRFFEKSWQ